MMPKISGFEMLDIIRNTEGHKKRKSYYANCLRPDEDQNVQIN